MPMEEFWRYLVGNYSQFTLFTILPTILVNLTYVLGSLFCLGLDRVAALRDCKIQGRYNATTQIKTCAKHLVLVKLLVEVPMTMSAYPILKAVGVSAELPLPPPWLIALQIVGFFFIEDAWHYFAHRLLHVKWAYKKIHYLHHTYSTPFGMAANYAHPVETVWLGFGTILPVLLFGPHLYTMCLWIVARQIQAISVHVGYFLPWAPSRFLPLIGGAPFHDRHHTKYNYNYAPMFTWLDRLFGTAWPTAKS